MELIYEMILDILLGIVSLYVYAKITNDEDSQLKKVVKCGTICFFLIILGVCIIDRIFGE